VKFAPKSPAALVEAIKARQKDGFSSALGRRRSHNGSVAEDAVEGLNDECLKAGVARSLRKSQANLKIIGGLPGGFLKCRAVKKSGADFIGILADGRGVAIEAKHVEIAVDADRRPKPVSFAMSHVEEHQAKDLDDYLAAGGVAVLLVIHGEGLLITAYAVPWAEVRKSGLRTLSAEFLSPWRVRRGEPYLRRFLSEVSK
jgi:penicillin-binding protein-related factor A (putative recombinase)